MNYNELIILGVAILLLLPIVVVLVHGFIRNGFLSTIKSYRIPLGFALLGLVLAFIAAYLVSDLNSLRLFVVLTIYSFIPPLSLLVAFVDSVGLKVPGLILYAYSLLAFFMLGWAHKEKIGVWPYYILFSIFLLLFSLFMVFVVGSA